MTASDDLNFAPCSQHEACALASMVVASLPFPPLLVMVMQGEDGADCLTSSFDLLQTAADKSRRDQDLGTLRPRALFFALFSEMMMSQFLQCAGK
jgi:hypothetical protein